MDIRRLKTLIAIEDHGGFTAAGHAIGLSHSAVSLHVKALEEELRVQLVDRSRRPPQLTERGSALVERARRMIELMDEIAALGSEERLVGSLSLGVAPSATVHLLPPALAALKAAHPDLVLHVRSGFSGDLAQLVRFGDLDVAIATAPEAPQEGLKSRDIAAERLFVVAPESAQERTDAALLQAHPFIWFSRKTWAGQQIERLILARGLRLREAMEVDSIEAIDALVGQGLGVAIAPERLGAPPTPEGLRRLPFCQPQAARRLAQIERAHNPKARLADALFEQLRAAAQACRKSAAARREPPFP